MSPFELGETRTREALPHLIVYINNGNDNDKRLAASALVKLIKSGVNCSSATPFLMKNTGSDKAQVRQYTYKALLDLELNEDYYEVFIDLYQKEDKDYNIKLLKEILKEFTSYKEEDVQLDKNTRIEGTIKIVNVTEPQIEKGYVYFIQEDYAGRIKIGKTVNLDQRMENFGVKLPFELELIHYVESNNHHYTEKLFHIHFNDKRVNGEWFELNEEDMAWIKSGCYTKRIIESINYVNKKLHNKKRFVPVTTKQAGFLSSLLNDNGFMLNKPIAKLSVEEASALIAHLYKGDSISHDLVELISSSN